MQAESKLNLLSLDINYIFGDSDHHYRTVIGTKS